MGIGHELGEGRAPKPEWLADSHAAWIVISNTETPQQQDMENIYPVLRNATDAFRNDTDHGPIRNEWMDRVATGCCRTKGMTTSAATTCYWF